MNTFSQKRAIGLAVILALAPVGMAQAQNSDALDGWDTYVAHTEARIHAEEGTDRGWPSSRVSSNDAAVAEGAIRVEEMETLDSGGKRIETPDAMVHHWRGVVFVPGADLDRVIRVVQDPEGDIELQEDVIEARVLDRDGDRLRVFLKLKRSKIVTAVYNTEHAVAYTRHGNGRASSRTVATKIRELDDPGSADERERPVGEDRGFLWKLNSYWRYEQTERGVLIECESISLSRSIPFLVRPFVRPIVEGVARESLERTLESLRSRLATPGGYQVE